jgi:hypothetical protein
VYLLLGETVVAAQQNQSALLAEKIDSTFAQWNSNQTAGYAVGVTRDGAFVFDKDNGFADLNMVFRFHRNSASVRSPRQVSGGHEMPLDYQAVDMVVGRDPRNIRTIVYPESRLFDQVESHPPEISRHCGVISHQNTENIVCHKQPRGAGRALGFSGTDQVAGPRG